MAKARHDEAARKQSMAQQARRAWTRERIEQIHSRVSAYDVLRTNGVLLKQAGDDREEQFSCPFHGRDRKPSARVYPESARSPSHAWCFVCQERWDAISLWQRFNPGEMSFSQALSQIEKTYGLKTPELSADAHLDHDPQVNEDRETFERLHALCEARLKDARPAFKALDDMVGYLRAGSVLDKIRYRVDNQTMKLSRANDVLEQLRDRIGEKERSWPGG